MTLHPLFRSRRFENEKTMQTIFLTGATGYFGGSIATRLVAGGTRVRGLVRTQENAARQAQRGVEPVLGSLEDAALLRREASAADGVINAASADHPEPVRAVRARSELGWAPRHTSVIDWIKRELPLV